MAFAFCLLLLTYFGDVDGTLRHALKSAHSSKLDFVKYLANENETILSETEFDRKALFGMIEPLSRHHQGEREMRERLTKHILSNVDVNGDPCDNFFRFSCGGWLRRNQIPPDETAWGILDQLQRENDRKLVARLQTADVSDLGKNSAVWKAKVAYDQCVDENRTDARTPALIRQMVWKIIAGKSGGGSDGKMRDSYYEPKTMNEWDFNRALIRAHRFHGSKSFFDFFPFTDNFDPRRRILKFEEAGLAFSDPAEMKNPNKTKPYRDLVFGVAKAALLLRDADAARFAENVMKVERALAKIYAKPEDKVDAGKTFHKVPMSKLFDGRPKTNPSILSSSPLNIDWIRLLEAHDVFNFTRNSVVDLSDPNYFSNLNRLLASADVESVRDYVVWTILNVDSNALPTAFRSLYRDYRRRVYGRRTDHPVSVRCLKIIAKMFPFTVSRIYQNVSFPESHKRYVTSLVEFLRTTLMTLVPEVKWMDAETQNRTRAKIVAMATNLGYPDFVVNSTELDEAVEGVDVVASETLWQTFQKYLANDVADYDRLLSTNRSRFGWSYADVSEANAGYKPASNNLEFPAGILQKPVFDPAFPKFWNFGSIASVIGHEMSHGFDESGSQFDGEGRQRNWWSSRSLSNFRLLSRCIVDFYSGFEIEGIRVNGNLTLDENIADVGGLSLAFRSFQRWKQISSSFGSQSVGGGGGGGGKGGRRRERRGIGGGRGGGKAETDEGGAAYPLAGISLTEEQLFFVAFGQTWCESARRQTRLDAVKSWEHCPQPVRTEAALALVPDFARVFRCPPNSKLNPSRRCNLW